jgi:hypothetical protein
MTSAGRSFAASAVKAAPCLRALLERARAVADEEIDLYAAGEALIGGTLKCGGPVPIPTDSTRPGGKRATVGETAQATERKRVQADKRLDAIGTGPGTGARARARASASARSPSREGMDAGCEPGPLSRWTKFPQTGAFLSKGDTTSGVLAGHPACGD